MSQTPQNVVAAASGLVIEWLQDDLSSDAVAWLREQLEGAPLTSPVIAAARRVVSEWGNDDLSADAVSDLRDKLEVDDPSLALKWPEELDVSDFAAGDH